MLVFVFVWTAALAVNALSLVVYCMYAHKVRLWSVVYILLGALSPMLALRMVLHG